MSSLKTSDVELTSVRYKDHVQRGNYAKLESQDIAYFKDLLGKTRVVTDTSDLEGHNVDWLKIVRGTTFMDSLYSTHNLQFIV